MVYIGPEVHVLKQEQRKEGKMTTIYEHLKIYIFLVKVAERKEVLLRKWKERRILSVGSIS